MKTQTIISALLLVLLSSFLSVSLVAQTMVTDLEDKRIVGISGEDEPHRYNLQLSKGQFFSSLFLHAGLEMEVSIVDPKGMAVVLQSTRPLLKGKWLAFRALQTGDYTITVSPKYVETTEGTYQFMMQAKRVKVEAKSMSNSSLRTKPTMHKQLVDLLLSLPDLYAKLFGSAKLEYEMVSNNEGLLEQFRTASKNLLLQTADRIIRDKSARN